MRKVLIAIISMLLILSTSACGQRLDRKGDVDTEASPNVVFVEDDMGVMNKEEWFQAWYQDIGGMKENVASIIMKEKEISEDTLFQIGIIEGRYESFIQECNNRGVSEKRKEELRYVMPVCVTIKRDGTYKSDTYVYINKNGGEFSIKNNNDIAVKWMSANISKDGKKYHLTNNKPAYMLMEGETTGWSIVRIV